MSPVSGVSPDQREREFEAREDRAQIVTDAGEHRRALLDVALDAAFHLDEGIAGAADFARAARPEFRLAAHAEGLGCRHEPHDRRDLIAQEGHGDDDQHKRCAKHPEQEDIGVRGIGGAAIGDDAQDRIVEKNANLDQIGAPDRVEPEGTADLALISFDSAPSTIEKNGFGSGGGNGPLGMNSISIFMRSCAIRVSVS